MSTTSETTYTEAEHLNLHAKHFGLLRLAKLRGLKVRVIGEGVHAVTSHTRRADGLEWVVSGGVCSCPARGYCSHLAASVDYRYRHEVDPPAYRLYDEANANDRMALRLRVRSGETNRNDRIYLAYCLKYYERKRRAAGVSLTTREVYAGGGRYRTETKCGAFTV